MSSIVTIFIIPIYITSYVMAYTHSSPLAGAICQDLRRKTKIRNIPPPQSNILVFFGIFLFFAETLRWVLFCFSLQLPEHYEVWVENLLELWNDFDAPRH